MKVAGLSDLHYVMGFGMVSAEGDNIVMLQQTARNLLKKLQQELISPEDIPADLSKLSLEDQIVKLFELRYVNELV